MSRIVIQAAKASLTLVVSMTAMAGADAQKPQTLDKEAKRQLGQAATLCGVVVAYHCQLSDRIALLDLETLSTEAGVSVAIAATDRDKFGRLIESRSAGRRVCATGIVEKQKNRYVIAVSNPADLQVEDHNPAYSPVDFGPDAVSQCEVGVELPKVVKRVRPQYSHAALRARISGVVLLEAVVLPDGRVGRTRLLRSLDAKRGLDDEAVKALDAWRFAPGTLNGRPVPVIVTVELTFEAK